VGNATTALAERASGLPGRVALAIARQVPTGDVELLEPASFIRFSVAPAPIDP
jgi:hypothetical protein